MKKRSKRKKILYGKNKICKQSNIIIIIMKKKSSVIVCGIIIIMAYM